MRTSYFPIMFDKFSLYDTYLTLLMLKALFNLIPDEIGVKGDFLCYLFTSFTTTIRGNGKFSF